MGHFLQVGLSSPNLQRSSLAVAYRSNSWHPGHNSLLPSFFLQYKRIICSTTRCSSFILFIFYIKNGSSVASSSALSTTSLVRHNTSPLRKSMSVGTDWMRYWLAVTPYLSTSTLMIRMRSPNTLFTCSRMVHHLAWLAPCSKEINQNKLATVYYAIECLHNYLSISACKKLVVL